MGRELAGLIVPVRSRTAHRDGIKRFLAAGEGPILSKRFEIAALHRDGHEFPVELTIWPVNGPEGVRFNSLIDDITSRKQLEEQLRHQALHDPLTGLANRTLFADRVQHALDRSARTPKGVAVLFLDLDDFKMVNDSLGHAAGDALLIAVAERVSGALRPGDTPARLGGDEFAVLVEDVTDDAAQIVAARLLGLFTVPLDVEGKPVHTQVSIGIAEADALSSTPGDLLRNADLAMYMAKERGKGRYERYAVKMHEQVLRKVGLKAALESAVAHDALEVHYQPIVGLVDGAIVGVEALLRWRGSDGQFVPLTEVIPLAEETGLIIPIGRFVLRQACTDVRRWQTSVPGADKLEVSVNVAAAQLKSDSLIDDVRAALSVSGLPASSLVLEITESAFIGDDLDALRALRRLRQLGLRLALDDFGTGYSSLSQLRHFQLDIVKIDRSFVSAITRSREGALVRSIIDMGRSMGLGLVAEGIETAAQLVALRSRGCELGQGRYFSMAVPAADMVGILTTGRFSLPRTRRRAPAIAQTA
jgi:diguanylate cyclase (GGDEF)-like protein